MKISIVFVSIILVISVFLPFLIFIYNGSKNTTSTKKQLKNLIKESGINYDSKEIWRKNFIGISVDNKILSYINVSNQQPVINNFNIDDLKLCGIVKNYNKDKDNVVRLKSLSLEIIYKTGGYKNILIPFFNVDDDLSEDFEIQRIEKWHALITKAIPIHKPIKIAS